MPYPYQRLRRLRATSAIRDLVSDIKVNLSDLILPVFVAEGLPEPKEIPSLTGQFWHNLESLINEAKEVKNLGINALMIFGIPLEKDEVGVNAFDPNGIVAQAVRKLKSEFKDDLVVLCDLCLDEYRIDGQCGVLKDSGEIDNDKTLELYEKIAVTQALAGADFVCPSGMMDGQVKAIREALDEAGFVETGILSYSVKYASALYGPFRDAVKVDLKGYRKSYQQAFDRSVKEARLEAALDVQEGADIVMVKPAITNLDVIKEISSSVDVPVFAYQVSGEYQMIIEAGLKGLVNLNDLINETLVSIKRAGASAILTYFAKQYALRQTNG
jgi:porphobilinogen synthase